MAECPSGKYLSEIVTASGLTPAHPLEDADSTLLVPHSLMDWSGSEFDYQEWHSLSSAFVGRLEQAWMELKVWPATARMPVSQYNALVDEINAIRQRYAKLRSPWSSEGSAFDTLAWHWGIAHPTIKWDSTEEIMLAVALCVDAQCLRQRINEILASTGGNPTTPGDTAHTPSDDGLGILGTTALVLGCTALVGGVIYFARKKGQV